MAGDEVVESLDDWFTHFLGVEDCFCSFSESCCVLLYCCLKLKLKAEVLKNSRVQFVWQGSVILAPAAPVIVVSHYPNPWIEIRQRPGIQSQHPHFTSAQTIHFLHHSYRPYSVARRSN